MMRTWLLLVLMSLSGPLLAAAAPTPPLFTATPPGGTVLKARDIEKLTGRKLSLLQKAQLAIAQRKWRRAGGEADMTARQKRLAQTSMVLGIASIVVLFLPYIAILALPAAILAVIFGARSLKGNSNTKGIVGIITGGLTLLLFVVAILVLIAFFGFM